MRRGGKVINNVCGARGFLQFIMALAQCMSMVNGTSSTSIELIHTDDLEALSFTAFDRSFDLKIIPTKHQLIAEGARILTTDALESERYFNESNAFKKCEFYHAEGPELFAAISYCEQRGFWGRITTKEGVFDIKKFLDDQHHITKVNVEQEMKELHVNERYLESISFLPPFADDANIPRRLRTEDATVPAIREECAPIEMLFIYMPSILKYYGSDEAGLHQDALAMLNEAQVMYDDTAFIKYGVEFICFNLVLGDTIHAEKGTVWHDDAVERMGE